MGVVVAILAAAGAVLLSVRQRDRRMQAWLDAASSCGLQVMEVSGFSGLEARAGPLEVRIDLYKRRTLIVIVIPGPLDFSVRIRPEPLIPASRVREIEIGSAAFDSAFRIEGPPRLVLALLDAETRRLLLRLETKWHLEVSDGTMRAEMFHQEVSDLLPLLLDIGRRLAQPMDVEIPRRLAENAKQDPEVGVRLQNLLLLARELPGEKETVEALRAGCADVSPQIRLRAAMELGADGRDVLMALAESTEDDACSAQAVRRVGGALPFERKRAILAQAMLRDLVQTAHACLEALGRSGTDEAVEALANVMAGKQSDLRVTAAQALGETGNAAAEPPLIKALQRHPADLRVAAANALGNFGSPAAVLPLNEAAARFPADEALGQAARQAIAAIQARLPGASPGQLSLSGAEAGQLSLAQAERGQLSLAPGEAGRLSLNGGEEG